MKHQRERESMDYITDLLKPLGDDIAREFLEIWLEYEEGTTKEAVFVKDGECTRGYRYIPRRSTGRGLTR